MFDIRHATIALTIPPREPNGERKPVIVLAAPGSPPDPDSAVRLYIGRDKRHSKRDETTILAALEARRRVILTCDNPDHAAATLLHLMERGGRIAPYAEATQ